MQEPWLPEEDQARVGIYTLLARLLAAPADQVQLEELANLDLGTTRRERLPWHCPC